jgi:hypothetical protein
VVRVGRGPDPFEPPPWEYALEDGTFGNRYDDPGAARGIPREHRFRVVYCSTSAEGAFGETIARFRPAPALIAGLEEIEDDEPVDPALFGGIVPADWRMTRRLGMTRLDRSMRFLDLVAPDTVHALRRTPQIAQLAANLGLPDIDYSAVNGPNRTFTQALSRFVYESSDAQGNPLFGGIRYTSRLNPQWECWAIYLDRMVHTPDLPTAIHADNRALLKAAALLGLTVEVIPGTGVAPAP